MTLRAELQSSGQGVGQLSRSLSRAVPNAISVSFNPVAGVAMLDAAVKDILEKLDRGGKLLQSDAVPNAASDGTSERKVWRKGGTVVVAAGAMMGAAVASNKASSSSSTMTIACADIPTANEPVGV